MTNKFIIQCLLPKPNKLILEEMLRNRDFSFAKSWEIITKYNLGSFVYYQLKKAELLDLVPQQAELKKDYIATLTRNTFLLSHLEKLIDKFDQAGIPFVILKGLVFSHLLYPDAGMRPSADIDLLFKEKDLPQVEALLKKEGFQQGRFVKGKRNPHHLTPYNNEDYTLIIEPHYQLVPYVKLDIGAFWENAVKYQMKDKRILVFSPEDLLIYLALLSSFAANSVISLKSLTDLAWCLAKSPKINWELFCQKVKQEKVTEDVFIAFYLADKFFGAVLPDKFLESLQTEDLHWLEKVNIEKIDTIKDTVNPKFFHRRQATRTLQDILWPTQMDISFTYDVPANSPKIYFYYLVNIFRVIKKALLAYLPKTSSK